MTGKAQDGRQFPLLDGGLEAPPSEQPEVRRQPQRRTKALETLRTPPPPHRAPRGDLFREYAERQWASPEHTQPTPEDVRRNVYRSLAESVGRSIYRRKKTIKGPIDKLRRAVGSNRYCEFAEWLNRIDAIKGASVTVRYCALLALIEKRIEEVAIEYRYTYDDFDKVSFYTSVKQELDTARDRVRKARADTVELQPLLYEMANLYARLGCAKRMAANPPPRMSDEERRALLAGEAQKARNRRVAESRQWLRDLTEPDKHSDDDVRCGGRWICFASLAEVLGDDLRGCVGRKPLWPSQPTVAELAQDYRISQRDARRLLAAYGGAGAKDAGATPQNRQSMAVAPSAAGVGGNRGAGRAKQQASALPSAPGTHPVVEVGARAVAHKPRARRP